MKHAKKLFSLALALIMALALAVPAMAAQEGELTGGSITINDAIPKQTYNIYQLLYLESYNPETNAYSYKANSAWEDWLKTQSAYVSFDDQGYVTWVTGASAADFAKLALEHAKTNSIDADADPQTAPAAADGEEYSTVTFSGLKLGYYLVDSSAGALCSLDTTNPDAVMNEKNAEPTIDKEDKSTTDSDSPSVGDDVNFEITITAQPGAENYVLHDAMGDGLALKAETIKVTGADITAEDYTVKTSELTDGCDFEIIFTEEYLNSIATETVITVTYTATITPDAIQGVDAVTNQAILDYGDDKHTVDEDGKTVTNVYSFDIVKTDKNMKLLDGATFELYDAAVGGNKIALVKEGNVYRVATTEEQAGEGFVSAVIEAEDGRATVDGLGNGTYYLQEVDAPEGYNKLAERKEVVISGADISTTMTGDTWNAGDGGVQITNNTGTELPSTGGMGTTIFYVVGGVLMAGAAVLLVTKKKMSR